MRGWYIPARGEAHVMTKAFFSYSFIHILLLNSGSDILRHRPHRPLLHACLIKLRALSRREIALNARGWIEGVR